MRLFSYDRDKFGASNTGRLGIASTTRSATFLVIACLAALVILSNLSCHPEPTHTLPPVVATTDTLTPTITPAPTDTPTLTPSPTPPHPLVTLAGPEDDFYQDLGLEVLLRWSWSHFLERDEYYQLRVKAKEQESFTLYHTKEDHCHLNSLLPGEYRWAVSTVRSIVTDTYEPVSEESEWRHFHILPPAPVVLGISPTSMVEGGDVQVVVSGENFTPPITLTIDVPLHIIDVAPQAITATVPATLTVNEYPVIVQDSNGRVVSSTVSLLVKEKEPPQPPPPPSPASASCNLPSVIPMAPPGYNPGNACVITPCAPAPQLVGPDDGAQLTAGSTVEYKWTWVCCLPPGWKFAVRLSAEDPPHSWQYIDDPAYVSCQGGMSTVHYPIKLDPETLDRLTTIPGTYYWNIAVTRSVEGGWERLSADSESRIFVVKPPEGDGCPVPPCD